VVNNFTCLKNRWDAYKRFGHTRSS